MPWNVSTIVVAFGQQALTASRYVVEMSIAPRRAVLDRRSSISGSVRIKVLRHSRQILFAEMVPATVLCVPPSAPLPKAILMGTHLTVATVQIVGSLWIRWLSPNGERDCGVEPVSSV